MVDIFVVALRCSKSSIIKMLPFNQWANKHGFFIISVLVVATCGHPRFMQTFSSSFHTVPLVLVLLSTEQSDKHVAILQHSPQDMSGLRIMILVSI